MDVVDARARRALDSAADHARGEWGWLLLNSALTALVVWFAAHGVAGVAPALLWFVAGVVAAEAERSLRSAVRAWWELRRLRRCSVCPVAAADLDDAYERGARHARLGHERVAR